MAFDVRLRLKNHEMLVKEFQNIFLKWLLNNFWIGNLKWFLYKALSVTRFIMSGFFINL